MTGAQRLLLTLSVVAGLAYPLSWLAELPQPASIALKGSGVALLAACAMLGARSRDGWTLALVMALGAAGDVLLELSFGAGAAAFAAGHGVAITLYLRNRRETLAPADWAVAGLLLAFGAVMPVLILGGREGVAPFTIYALLLSAMAATAWLSRFPRHLTGLGALMFVASDALIALRLASGAELGLPIWLLYYFGQLLIFLGVSRAAAR